MAIASQSGNEGDDNNENDDNDNNNVSKQLIEQKEGINECYDDAHGKPFIEEIAQNQHGKPFIIDKIIIKKESKVIVSRHDDAENDNGFVIEWNENGYLMGNM